MNLIPGKLVAIRKSQHPRRGLVRVCVYPLPPSRYHGGSPHYFVGRRFDPKRGIWLQPMHYLVAQVVRVLNNGKRDRHTYFPRRNAAGRPKLLTVTDNGASA